MLSRSTQLLMIQKQNTGFQKNSGMNFITASTGGSGKNALRSTTDILANTNTGAATTAAGSTGMMPLANTMSPVTSSITLTLGIPAIGCTTTAGWNQYGMHAPMTKDKMFRKQAHARRTTIVEVLVLAVIGTFVLETLDAGD